MKTGFSISVAISFLIASPAMATWLDPFDPTPRTVQVEFEISSDPAAVGQTYSPLFEASYSVTGNVGTLLIEDSVYESAMQAHGPVGFSFLPIVAGSVGDFSLDIDLTTLEAVTNPPLSALVSVSVGPPTGTLTRDMGSEATAGFFFTNVAPFEGFPLFCTSGAFCTLVPGTPYDPLTGAVNAVGSDFFDHPDATATFFATAGDLRLSEVPEAGTLPLIACGLFAVARAGRRRTGALFRRRRRDSCPNPHRVLQREA